MNTSQRSRFLTGIFAAALIIAATSISAPAQNEPKTSIAISTDIMGKLQSMGAAHAGDPAAWFAIPPDKLPFNMATDNSGRRGVTLIGDPTKPGTYIMAVKWPPNVTAKAHLHGDDRYAIVLKGTFYFGHGSKFDAGKLDVRPVGTFFTEPAGIVHFGATHDDGCILLFIGTGPLKTTQIEK